MGQEEIYKELQLLLVQSVQLERLAKRMPKEEYETSQAKLKTRIKEIEMKMEEENKKPENVIPQPKNVEEKNLSLQSHKSYSIQFQLQPEEDSPTAQAAIHFDDGLPGWVIDTPLETLDETQTYFPKLSPGSWLPCHTGTGIGIPQEIQCLNLAEVGILTFDQQEKLWIMTTSCKACVRAMARLYDIR